LVGFDDGEYVAVFSCQFEKSLNATFVSLIPKKTCAMDVKDFRPLVLWEGCIRLSPWCSRTALSQYWARLSPTHRMLLLAIDKFWIQYLLLMNAWIVKFDWGNLGYCASWIWKMHIIMLIGTSCSICCSVVVLERNGGLGYDFAFLR
jgi:hypothetical protein